MSTSIWILIGLFAILVIFACALSVGLIWLGGLLVDDVGPLSNKTIVTVSGYNSEGDYTTITCGFSQIENISVESQQNKENNP